MRLPSPLSTPAAHVGALATFELLLARLTGGPVSPADVGAAAALWLLMAAVAGMHRRGVLVALVVYALGLLTPTVLHLPSWHVLSGVVAALLVVLLRDRLQVRLTYALWTLDEITQLEALGQVLATVDREVEGG